ncbi:MAG: polysaccharide pyruvyl transferase family protein [Candidatus Aminicenantes bacterium]|nr:polysaccharide pyruvyl transferase family protein [Candidatus Aminicenantes bacterium]
MGKTIVISGITDTRNNGCWSMATALINGMRRETPGVQFVFLTHARSRDAERLAAADIRFLETPWSRARIPKIRVLQSLACTFLLRANARLLARWGVNLFYPRFSRSLASADLLVDLGGDSISSDYNDYSVFFQVLPAALAHRLGIPYFFLAQSIGPFKDGWLYRWVKCVLSAAAAISVREKISLNLLLQAGIDRNTIPVSDLAFLLSPLGGQGKSVLLDEVGICPGTSYVAISTSSLIGHYLGKRPNALEHLVDSMAALCDHLVESYRIRIVFISHVMFAGNDDREMSRKVKARMKFSDNALLAERVFNGAELKAIIGECQAMIAMRMHAAIAAVSQYVPVLVLAYNHKVHGIFTEKLGWGDLVLDVRQQTEESLTKELFAKADRLLRTRSFLRRRLRESIPREIVKAQKNIRLVAERLR